MRNAIHTRGISINNGVIVNHHQVFVEPELLLRSYLPYHTFQAIQVWQILSYRSNDLISRFNAGI